MPNPNDSRCLLASLVIVEQEGKYLLIKESKEACRNKWFLPGGRTMPDESMIQAAVRESKEESGVDVELIGLLFLDQLIDSDPSKNRNRIRFVFLGKPTGGELKQSEDEHSICAGWFSEAEAARLELRSPFVLDILKIHRESPAILPISRIHILAQEDLHRERP
jgi:ADP-ribose pyrophosphatase YjhB (NUDIX family)